MNELVTLINALGAFVTKFGVVGWIILIIGILIWKAKAIITWITEHIIKPIAPLWVEKRKIKLEQTKQEIEHAKAEQVRQAQKEQDEIQHQRELQAQEQVNTTMMWKDLILEYRKRLDDSEIAINRLQAKVFDVVAQNEKLNAQVLQSLQDYKQQNERLTSQAIEVIRDFAAVVRAQTTRLDQITLYIQQKE